MNGDQRLDALESRIGWLFQDRGLLERALTHSSYGDGARQSADNERLEFLGDRVLGLLAARTLFDRFDDVPEGELAPRLNALVRKETCARVARAAGLGEALRLSPAEEKSGGREKDSILGDAAEALFGALYLDGGVTAARSFFDAYWDKELEQVEDKPKDPKTRLQEWALANGYGVPSYRVAARLGPDHQPVFTVEAVLEGVSPEEGKGGSKQEAERNAAAALYARETRG